MKITNRTTTNRTTTNFSFLLLCLLCGFIPLMYMGSALAQQQESVRTTIKASGECLEAIPTENPDIKKIQRAECNGTPFQQWQINENGTITGSDGNCLDLSGAATTEGSDVILFSCHGGYNQQWNIRFEGIITDITGKCFDINTSGTDSTLKIRTCKTGLKRQLFDISEPVEITAHGKCLVVGGRGIINLKPCKQGATQGWYINSNGTITGAGGCLDTNIGGNVVLLPCHNGNGQKWTVNKNGKIIDINGKCLDVKIHNSKYIVSMRTCETNNLNQLFTSTLPVPIIWFDKCLTASSSGDISFMDCKENIGQAWYINANDTITAANGKCLDVTNSGTKAGTAVILYTCNGGNNQQWNTQKKDRIIADNGKCLSRSESQLNKLLTISTCSNSNSYANDHQLFFYTPPVQIKAVDKCMEIITAGEGEIKMMACDDSWSQAWHINDDGMIFGGDGNCLDVTGGSSEDGTMVMMYNCHGGENQQWTFQNNGTITGLSGKCLNVTSDTAMISSCINEDKEKSRNEDNEVSNQLFYTTEQALGKNPLRLYNRLSFGGVTGWGGIEIFDPITIGGKDVNKNGIRDDIEEKLTNLFRNRPQQKGYAEHLAHYLRSFMMATADSDKKRYIAEVLKGYACLIDTTGGEDGYNQIVAGHLDSKDRFTQYLKNLNFLNQQSITVDNMDCVLNGSGVESPSACYRDFDHGPFKMFQRNTTTLDNLIMGENVNLTITFKNIKQSGGSYVARMFLDKVEKEKIKITEGNEHSFVIDNYLFETDGYLDLTVREATADYIYHVIITCEPNS